MERVPTCSAWPPAWLKEPAAPELEISHNSDLAGTEDVQTVDQTRQLAPQTSAEMEEDEAICVAAEALFRERERREGPCGKPLPAEVVKQWLADTEYDSLLDWLQARGSE